MNSSPIKDAELEQTTVAKSTHNSIQTTHKCWNLTEEKQPDLSGQPDSKELISRVRETAHFMGTKTAYQFYSLAAEIERVRTVCHVLTEQLRSQCLTFCNKNLGWEASPEEARPSKDVRVIVHEGHEDGVLSYQVEKLTAARFGFGDQSEASLAAWVDANEFSASMRLKIESREGKKATGSYHIVILHPSDKELQKLNDEIEKRSRHRRGEYSTIDVLNNLPEGCVVLDPVMRICCVGEKIRTEGEALRNYIINKKLCYPVFATILSEKTDKKNLIEPAALVLKHIQNNIDKISYNPHAHFYGFVEDYVNSSINGFKGATFQSLEEAFPGTKWRFAVKGINLSFATDCNEEQKNQIVERLSAHPPKAIPHRVIPVKEDRYIVTITDGFCIFKD